jgi:hypothetical protein
MNNVADSLEENYEDSLSGQSNDSEELNDIDEDYTNNEDYDDEDDLDLDITRKGSPVSWLKSRLSMVHPAFLIGAVVATIWIQWVMIPMQSFEDQPTVWWGLGVYLVVTVLTIILLKYLFSIRYKTLLSVMTANNIALTIPLGAIISLATGYTLVQLFSPEWEFTHDFVYIMVVSQLVVTSILLFGIWWKARKEVPTERDESVSEEDESGALAERKPSLTHSSALFTQNDVQESRGMVNGLTNGVKNGFNVGRSPGDSLTNGLGMVNGVTNGLGTSEGLQRRNLRIPTKRTRKVVVPVTAFGIIAMLLFMPVLLVPSSDSAANRNWNGVASYSDDIEGLDPDVDIKEYSATSSENYLWTKVKVEGKMMGNELPDTSTVHVFIDSDRNPNTGYSIGALGADYSVRIYGYDGVIGHSYLFAFMSDEDPYNWNAWTKVGSVQSSVNKDAIQTRVPLSRLSGEIKPIVYFGMVDSFGSQDYSATPVDLANDGALMIRQSNIAPDIVERGVIDVVELEMTAVGRTIVLESIDVDLNPEFAYSVPTPVTMQEDQTRKFTIQMDTTGMDDGAFVNVALDPRGLVTDQGTVIIDGTGTRAYVGISPASIEVDGAFGDWIDETRLPVRDRAGEIENPNVDIIDYQNGGNSGNAYFYMRVDGRMMGGVKIPDLSEKRVPPQQASGPSGFEDNKVNIGTGAETGFLPPSLTGDDIAHIFIDSDQDKSTGYRPTHPFEFPIGADHMIEVTGRDGEIRTSSYFEFIGEQGDWNWSLMGSTASATDSTRLETGIPLEALGLEEPRFDAYLHITDWQGEEDYSDHVITDGGQVLHDFIPTRKNGGFPDGNIDTIDGGSCAGAFGCHSRDSTRVPITLSWNPAGPYDPGQTGIDITVTVNMDNAASGTETGIALRVGPTGGNAHYGIENDGWVIENDPHSNTNNYIQESGLQGQGDTQFTWTVTAPTLAGTYYVEFSVQYDDGDSGREYNINAESTVTVIPEFEDVFAPVLSILVVSIVVGIARRNSLLRKRDE